MSDHEWNGEEFQSIVDKNVHDRETAPLPGEGDYRDRPVAAAAAGAADVGSFGLLDEIQAGVGTMPGRNYAERYMAKLEEASAQGDALARQNPKSNFAGGLLGGIVGGGAANAGAKTLIKRTVKGRKALKWVDSWTKRAAVAGVAGATEGGAYAYNENLDVPLGVSVGTAFGVGGQLLLGEVMTGLYRAGRHKLTGKVSHMDEQVAKEETIKLLRSQNRDLSGEDLDELWEMFKPRFKALNERLGNKATFADLSDEVRGFNLGTLAEPVFHEAGLPFMKAIQGRMKESKDRMLNGLEDILGDEPALSPTDVAEIAGRSQKTYAPVFKQVLEDSDVKYPVRIVAEMIEGEFAKAGFSTNEADAAYRAILKSLKRNVELDDDGNLIGNLSAKKMDGIVKQLDNLFNIEVDPFSPTKDKHLGAQLSSIRSNIRGLLNNVPGYEKINRLYATTRSAAESHKIGAKLATDDVEDWTALAYLMENQTATDMLSMMDGAKWAIFKELDEGGEAAINTLLSNGTIRKKLAKAFGPDTADDLLAAAASAARLTETEMLQSRAVTAGVTKSQPNPMSTMADVGIVGLGATPVGSNIAMIGAGRRLAAGVHGPELRKRQAMSQLAAQSGPEARALLNDTLPNIEKGPRAVDHTDKFSSGLGAFGASALPGERRNGPQ